MANFEKKRLQEQYPSLTEDDIALVLEIKDGLWVAYDDSGLFVGCRRKTPDEQIAGTPLHRDFVAFKTKTELMNEIATQRLDGRKFKTVDRKGKGLYTYSVPAIDTPRRKHLYAVERVTKKTVPQFREMALCLCCPASVEI